MGSLCGRFVLMFYLFFPFLVLPIFLSQEEKRREGRGKGEGRARQGEIG
jgi:hypothetical protein